MSNNRDASPVWSLQNAGSFASVRVDLPPDTHVCCESDAVVSLAQGVTVRGQLGRGGLLGALARTFLTRESFFTTKVHNTNARHDGDVLMAPSEPGGIVLHRLHNGDDGLYLTGGAYVASDATVQITSRVQRGLANSVWAGTGLFLLHAAGHGTIACAAYGAVHAYRLQRGETRVVDNGHLVAWTAGMRYTTGWACRGAGNGMLANITASVTSGEGLMCYFEGPGVLYIQSHKPKLEKEGDHKTSATPFQFCVSLVFLGLFVGIFVFYAVAASQTSSPYERRYQQRYNEF